jgi:predicted DNA-binding transcriptional regulator AlpA
MTTETTIRDESAAEDPSPILSIRDAAHVLGMGTATAYDHVRKGTFPVEPVLIGGRHKILRSDLDRFLAGKSRKKKSA